VLLDESPRKLQHTKRAPSPKEVLSAAKRKGGKICEIYKVGDVAGPFCVADLPAGNRRPKHPLCVTISPTTNANLTIIVPKVFAKSALFMT
jgi:hypothetical protein